jgi:hypothetical protein
MIAKDGPLGAAGFQPGMCLGRCHPCQVGYFWQGPPLMREMTCPQCHTPLRRTSSQWAGHWRPLRRKERTRAG